MPWADRFGGARRASPLQGLLVCGQCGRRLSPRYLGQHGFIVWYECNWRRRQLAGKACWSIRGDLLDEAVARALEHHRSGRAVSRHVVAVSGSVFLILELDQPFNGLIQISSQPMLNALSQLGR